MCAVQESFTSLPQAAQPDGSFPVIVIIFMGIIKPQFTRLHSGTYHGYFADIIFYSESEMKLICSTFSLLLVLHSSSGRRSRQVRYNKLSSNISLSSANTPDKISRKMHWIGSQLGLQSAYL